MQYHVNDRLIDREAAAVSVDDRSFRYGDAAFETCRGYGGTVFAWDRHRRRLRQTCETLGMAEAVPKNLTGRIEATLAANSLSEAYLWVPVSGGFFDS